jgi:hypothetical protein
MLLSRRAVLALTYHSPPLIGPSPDIGGEIDSRDTVVYLVESCRRALALSHVLPKVKLVQPFPRGPGGDKFHAVLNPVTEDADWVGGFRLATGFHAGLQRVRLAFVVTLCALERPTWAEQSGDPGVIIRFRFSAWRGIPPVVKIVFLARELNRRLRNAKAKGVRLGRPRIFVSESRIDALRGAGASWRAIAKELGVALGTVHRTSQGRTKKRDGDCGTDSGGG